ncbi:MAG TPA: hypothetical protein VGJ08_14985 [Rhizomicrobium sp.]|jgi:hypothetical protein
MKASDVIESYVADVAAQLPSRQRADVAVELRSLLNDELNAKPNDPSTPDAALALVRAFGRPADVAARYHAPYVLIEPADTRSFLLAAVVGASLIPSSNGHLPISLDKNTAGILLLAWLGTLLLFYAGRSWLRRRQPNSFQWKPSPVRDRDAVSFPLQLGIVLLCVFGIAIYLSPGPAISLVSGGRVAADSLRYTQDFLQPWRLLGFPILLSIFALLNAFAALRRRWTPLLRGLSICFLVSAAIQLGWHASSGDLFASAVIDRSARLALQLLGAALMITAAIETYREWIRIPAATQTGHLSLAAEK